MALNLQNKYPGRFDPVSADYPQGKFKNRSSPTAQDGSYMERDWLNDWNGFFGALLNGAGVVPNGSVDTAQSSQLFTALQTVILKSLPKRSFSANDYIRIPDVPGGLIIQWGGVSGSSQTTVTYPTQFPNGVVAAVASSDGGSSSPVGERSFVEVGAAGSSSLNLSSVRVVSGVQEYYPRAMRWVAIGW